MDNLVDKCFCKHDIKLLKGMGLKAPSEVDNGEEITMHDAAEKLLMKVGGIKGKAIQNRDKEITDEADTVMNLLRVYKGVMIPNKSRNNKINSSGEFGDLVIHLPGLLSHGILKVFANGKKVLDEVVDRDTIDLLMKRLDKKKHYSRQSKNIFDKLIQLNGAVEYGADDDSYDEEPDTRTPFSKSLLEDNEVESEEEEHEEESDDESDTRTPFYKSLLEDIEEESDDDTDELLKRLETLGNDISNGDISNETRDEFAIIVNQLHEIGIVDDNQRELLYDKYLL